MGNSCSVDHIFSLYFVILVIFRFGFEGWIWVLIASVPDLCHYSSGRKSLSILVHGALLIELCLQNLSLQFLTRSDTNQDVQPQKMARGLKFLI